MTAAPQSIQPSIASIIHELRASGDPTEEAWAEVIESLRVQYADANADAIRLHHEKMDQYDRATEAVNSHASLRARVEELEKALGKISGQATSAELRAVVAGECMRSPEAAQWHASASLADFEGGYDECVIAARAALNTGEGE